MCACPRGAACAGLCRPLICICNDLYAPVLRPLRDVAHVFAMNTVAPGRLIERLNLVCTRERIFPKPGVLGALCARADNDIRTCLNGLQFVSARSSIVTMDAVTSASVGQRDQSRSLFELWETIFTSAVRARGTGRKRGAGGGNASKTGSSVAAESYARELLQKLTSSGDSEKLIDGPCAARGLRRARLPPTGLITARRQPRFGPHHRRPHINVAARHQRAHTPLTRGGALFLP